MTAPRAVFYICTMILVIIAYIEYSMMTGDRLSAFHPTPLQVNGSIRRLTTPVPRTDYEFVIAHYNENLDWLKHDANYSHVYDKGHVPGSKPPFSVKDWEELPNVGREAHTYLYHIIKNYENLANITIFLQGQISNHAHLGFCYHTPLKFLERARKGVPCILIGKYTNWGRIAFGGKWKAELDRGLMRPANGSFGQFYEEIFGRTRPQSIDHCWAACFSATRKCLQKYPKEFYQKMISYLDDHPNPEEGHYLERLWRVIAKC